MLWHHRRMHPECDILNTNQITAPLFNFLILNIHLYLFLWTIIIVFVYKNKTLKLSSYKPPFLQKWKKNLNTSFQPSLSFPYMINLHLKNYFAEVIVILEHGTFFKITFTHFFSCFPSCHFPQLLPSSSERKINLKYHNLLKVNESCLTIPES